MSDKAQLTAIATIAGNGAERITLYRHTGSDLVWAHDDAEDEILPTDTPITRMWRAWHGAEWDLRMIGDTCSDEILSGTNPAGEGEAVVS